MNYKRRQRADRRRDPTWAKRAWLRAHYPTRDQRPRLSKSFDSLADRFLAEVGWLGHDAARELDDAIQKAAQR